MTTDPAAHDAAQTAVAAFAFAAEAEGYDLAALGEAMLHGGMILLRAAIGAEQAVATALIVANAAVERELHGS